MAGKYDDLLNLPHHQSDRRPHMPIHDRAAQFSPFAALTLSPPPLIVTSPGHKEMIEEEERQTERFREMDEGQMSILDGKLQILQENRSARPEVRIRYFVPDERKEGGAYRETAGRFQKLDEGKRQIVLEDGTAIYIEGIWDIQSELFEGLEQD